MRGTLNNLPRCSEQAEVGTVYVRHMHVCPPTQDLVLPPWAYMAAHIWHALCKWAQSTALSVLSNGHGAHKCLEGLPAAISQTAAAGAKEKS